MAALGSAEYAVVTEPALPMPLSSRGGVANIVEPPSHAPLYSPDADGMPVVYDDDVDDDNGMAEMEA